MRPRPIQAREEEAKFKARRLVSLPILYGVLPDYLQAAQDHHLLAPSRRGGRGIGEPVPLRERSGVDEPDPLLREEGRW
jgi:hypothetical protein